MLKTHICILVISLISALNVDAQMVHKVNSIEQKAKWLKNSDPDSALYLYKTATGEYLEQGDTLAAINTLIQTSRIYSSRGNYSSAYDGYWEALRYSANISDSSLIGDVYTGLGILYGIFGRNIEAEKYFLKSISVQKSLAKHDRLLKADLSNIYFVLTSYHRELGNYNLAQAYLDSCLMIKKQLPNARIESPYLSAEQGRLLYYKKDYDLALKLLLKSEQFFEEKERPYLVIIYDFFGDVYFEKNQYNKSEDYYLKSITVSEQYNAHKNYVTKVYRKLAELYLHLNNMTLAYKYQEKAREHTEMLFDARNKNNSMILNIKDEFRLEREKQDQLLESAKLHDLEQEQRILFLKNTVLSVSLASLLILAGLAFWYLQHKHKSDMIMHLNMQKISTEKNHEILEVKNKELTASALKLIQKDELLLDIKNSLLKLNVDDNKKEFVDVLNKIQIHSKQDWSEFNLRFTSVNTEFYKTLSNKFPELTQRDHKMCALIKLNFASKEISQLLGISMESVNTSRYRLRKKMHLQRSDNLMEFIANI